MLNEGNTILKRRFAAVAVLTLLAARCGKTIMCDGKLAEMTLKNGGWS